VDSETSELSTEEAKEPKDIEMESLGEYTERFNISRKRPTTADLPDILIAIKSSDLKIRAQATKYLKRLVASNEDPPVQAVFDNGLVPYLVEMIKDDSNYILQVVPLFNGSLMQHGV
jgi:hypothetical protein